MLNLERVEVVTFDCYGTLIDWEQGILSTLRPMFRGRNHDLADQRILESYALLESQAETAPFKKYKAVLRQVIQGFANQFGFTPTAAELECLGACLGEWPPFPDTIEALAKLGERFKLAVISNTDDDLFAQSARLLQVQFDWIVTSEQVGSYKPSVQNFHVALERIGRPRDVILHVAQSLYHDIVPAKRIGLSTVWVNRRGADAGSGATPPAQVQPDLEVPDLRSLVAALGL